MKTKTNSSLHPREDVNKKTDVEKLKKYTVNTSKEVKTCKKYTGNTKSSKKLAKTINIHAGHVDRSGTEINRVQGTVDVTRDVVREMVSQAIATEAGNNECLRKDWHQYCHDMKNVLGKFGSKFVRIEKSRQSIIGSLGANASNLSQYKDKTNARINHLISSNKKLEEKMMSVDYEGRNMRNLLTHRIKVAYWLIVGLFALHLPFYILLAIYFFGN